MEGDFVHGKLDMHCVEEFSKVPRGPVLGPCTLYPVPYARYPVP